MIGPGLHQWEDQLHGNKLCHQEKNQLYPSTPPVFTLLFCLTTQAPSPIKLCVCFARHFGSNWQHTLAAAAWLRRSMNSTAPSQTQQPWTHATKEDIMRFKVIWSSTHSYCHLCRFWEWRWLLSQTNGEKLCFHQCRGEREQWLNRASAGA